MNEKPDDIKFNMIDGELIESDIEGIKFAENRNWILNLLKLIIQYILRLYYFFFNNLLGNIQFKLK